MDERPTQGAAGAPADDGAADPSGATDLGALAREVYFPTLVYFRDFPDAAALNARLLSAIRAMRAEDERGIVRSNVPTLGGWHSRNTLHQVREFDDLSRRIRATAAEITKNLGYDPDWTLAIDNMWSIINPPGSYNRSHIHPSSLWSGVYYVQAPEDAGRIVFTDPRTAHLMLHPRYVPDRQRTAENWTEVYFDPIPGRLILFPSWLYHAVEANATQQTGEAGERVCISFNLYQRRPKSG